MQLFWAMNPWFFLQKTVVTAWVGMEPFFVPGMVSAWFWGSPVLRLEGAQKPETAVAWRFAAQQSGQFYWHDNMDL